MIRPIEAMLTLFVMRLRMSQRPAQQIAILRTPQSRTKYEDSFACTRSRCLTNIACKYISTKIHSKLGDHDYYALQIVTKIMTFANLALVVQSRSSYSPTLTANVHPIDDLLTAHFIRRLPCIYRSYDQAWKHPKSLEAFI